MEKTEKVIKNNERRSDERKKYDSFEVTAIGYDSKI